MCDQQSPHPTQIPTSQKGVAFTLFWSGNTSICFTRCTFLHSFLHSRDYIFIPVPVRLVIELIVHSRLTSHVSLLKMWQFLKLHYKQYNLVHRAYGPLVSAHVAIDNLSSDGYPLNKWEQPMSLIVGIFLLRPIMHTWNLICKCVLNLHNPNVLKAQAQVFLWESGKGQKLHYSGDTHKTRWFLIL